MAAASWSVGIWAAGLLAACPSIAADATPAAAQNPTINIIDLYQGGSQSNLATVLSQGGYELADQTWVSFVPWYSTDAAEVHADFLTELNDDFGLLWGFGTGEHGEKYRIDPSLKVGVITQVHPRFNRTLSIKAMTTLWGSFTEYPCIADYGDIGGVQQVNCRLAASQIPPAETLQYLVKSDPSRFRIDIAYRVTF